MGKTVIEIQQAIKDYVERRDGDAPKFKADVTIHLKDEDYLLCSTRTLLPNHTYNIDEVNCKWCLGRIEKGYHL